MDIPLIGGDKIRSLIKNATKDSSTGSNESLIKTNTRDSNNLIKDSNQLEMDRKNKIVIDNLNKGGNIITKNQGLFKGLKNSGAQNAGGGINVSQGGNLNNSEIKSRGLNIESGVNNVNDINNANVNNNIEGIRINKNNGVLTNPSNGRINGWGGGGGGWGDEGTIENETIGESKRMSQAVVDLYKVAGRLNEREEELDIDKLRNSFSEFDELTDDVLGDLVADLKVMNEEGDEDLLKIIEAYPELGKVRLSDLNDASKAALLGGLVDGDDSKWGLLDYALFAPNLISKGFGGKKVTDYRGDFADWAYDSKKMIQYTQKDEGEFLKDLHNKYAEYTNANGEWLPNATPEIKKQYKKEWDEYERKATLNNVGNSVANFFKGLPKIVDIALNIANHPEDLIKTLPRLVAGAPATGTEWIADKIEEKTGNNFLDKLAQRKGVETWQEMKEMMYDQASKGKGAFNKVAAWVLGSSEVSDGMREYIVDSYGSEENFIQTLVERPEDVISDAISIAEGAVGIAKGAGFIDAARAEMIIKNLGYFDMYEMSTKGAFQAEKWLLKNELNLAKKGLGKTMKNTEKLGGLLKRSPIGKMVSFVENKLTGLTEEERKFIRENGDIVEEYLKGNKSAEEIADMIMSRFDDLIEGKKAVGQFYDFIKNNEKLTVKTSGIISGIKGLLKELGIKIDRKGNLKFGALSYTPAQQRQLQQVYNYVKALEGLGDKATAKDVRRARQLIDSLINWEGNTKMGLDAEVMNSIRNMRSKIDDALKEQVKGFKEADAEYRELTNLVKELKKDWFTKDGKLKDNALSKIRNLTNKGNEAKLERLEKQFPGITRALKGLGVSQSIEKASKMMVGQYAQQLLIGGGLWKLINGDLSVAIALIGAGILTPKNLVKILKKEGDFMSKWRSVADNLSNGKVLSDEKINRLKRWLKEKSQEIGQKVAEEEGGKGWEKVDMDKVDLEYEKGQRKAYAGGKVTEKKLTKDERASLLKKYAKGSENNGFLMKIVDSMGEGEHGLTDLDNKLIKLEQNPGDTTIQHEFFHALFSVIDDDTKKYVINEVKNYLGLTDDVAAEERLAESFGIYARRREIKLGNIRLKGNRLQRFRSRISDLFQRAYEWIQDYSMDRKTINKLFNEVYGAVDGKVLDETGKFNLAEKLGINEKNSKLGGLEGEGLRYKKTGNLGKNDYTTTNGQEDRLLLGGLSTTEGGMKQATHAEGGRGNRGPQKAHLERVSSSDTANFFEHTDNKGRGYIEYNNGGGKVEKLYKQHELFDGYSEKLNKGLSKYKENLVKINDELAKNSSKKTSAVIGKTGHGKDIMISKEGLSHIYKHGNLDFNTLINAINDPTNQKQEVMGGRYRLEVRLDDGDTLVVGLQPKERVKGGKVKDVNSRVDADLYTVTSVTKGKPRGAESLEVRLKRDAKGRELSKGQQEYFKDSKVRDVNGGLLRMFHGTPNKGINVFDKSKIGTSTDSGVWGRGFYFTPDESYAEKYTKRNGNVGELKEAYIDIKKPFEIDLNDKATIDKFNESYMKYSPNLEDVWKKGLQKKYGELIDQGYEKGTQDLKDAGYDGVIVKRGGEIKEVVAFEPNQIKNIDNLNPSISDDIRYKKTGKGEGVDYNSTNLYGKIDQNGLTKKEGGSFGKLGAKGLSQGNGLDRGANKGVLQETSLTKLGAGKGGDGTSQKLVNVKDGSEMVKISQNLQNKQERGAFMDVHSAEEYNTYKNFTNKNKSATISVKPDGDIINFVSTEKGAGKDLMLRAIEEGGNKMDNYGVGLTSYYENFGFEPVARVKFNREYAPNNWNFVRDGEPDIFVMKHNGDSVDVVREKYGTYKHKTPEELDKLPVMEYDDALKYRDELQAKEGKGLRYKRAYHGSPAEFDRFDMEHMGEGEGRASHGWGLYFAKDKNIAKERYAERSHKYGISYEGGTLEEIKKKADEKGFYNLDIKDRVAYRLMNETKGDNMFNRFVDFDSAKEKSLSLIDDKISLAEYVIKNKGKDSITDKIYNEAMDSLPKLKEEKKVISNMKNGDFGIGEAKDRNLYAVDIPDEIKKDTPTGSNYFRESRTYNKQELGAILEKFKEKYPDKYDLLKNKFNTPLHGRRVYTSIADVLGGQKQASKFLESIGYDGVYAKGYIDKDVYVMFNNKGLDVKDHIRYKKDQTKTPEFRKWFEGSKVVKADGKPQVVYHGTTADFNVFNKIGGPGIYGDGYYFTDKIGTAKNYGADGGKVMKVYLDIKNPYEATMKDQYGLNVKKLKEQGYDGVKAKLGNETYWVAFDSNQIKSATDNVGTFDKSNPDIRYKKNYNWDREDMKKELIKRANEGFYDNLKKEYDGFLDDVTKNSGGYPVKAPLKYGSNGVDFSEKGKKGNRILDKGMKKEGGLNDVNDIVRGTIRVSNLKDVDKVVEYIKKNYKNVTDFDDKYRNPTPMGYVDYSCLYEGKNGAKAEVQINVTEMIVAKEKLKDALNYGITEKEYNDIAKRSGTKGGGLGHTFYDEQKLIELKLLKGGLSKNEMRILKGKIKVLARQSVEYYKSYMDLIKNKL